METKNRFWWGTAVLSVSALMLTACGDGNGNDAAAEETAAPAEEAEETAGDDAAEDDASEDDAAEADTAGTALSEDEVLELLLEEDEFPVDFEQFQSEEDVTGGEAIAMPDTGAVQSCDELAELMQDPESLEDFEESGEEIDATALVNAGMWNLESDDPSEMSMLQASVMSYDGDVSDFEEDYELIEECSGEVFTIEEQGYETEVTFDYIEYGDWQGVDMQFSSDLGGEVLEMDMRVLTYDDGANALVVAAMGEGKDYLEEVADLQLEKYETGV